MRREEIAGQHLLAADAERRRSEQSPLYLSHDHEFVTHIHWIRVGDDFLNRRRPHDQAELEGMRCLV